MTQKKVEFVKQLICQKTMRFGVLESLNKIKKFVFLL